MENQAGLAEGDGQESALTALPGQGRKAWGCPRGGATFKASGWSLSTHKHTGAQAPLWCHSLRSTPPPPHLGTGAPVPETGFPQGNLSPEARPPVTPTPPVSQGGLGVPLAASPSVLTAGRVSRAEQVAFLSSYKAPGAGRGSQSQSTLATSLCSSGPARFCSRGKGLRAEGSPKDTLLRGGGRIQAPRPSSSRVPALSAHSRPPRWGWPRRGFNRLDCPSD